MAKTHYEMKTERSLKMDDKNMMQLRDMSFAPYMQLATGLIGKARHAGGNMFRHQMDTLAILIDYGYIDSVLLKASIILVCKPPDLVGSQNPCMVLPEVW